MDAPAGVTLTDGGIETVLLFHDGFDLPCFASFPLLEDPAGRAALRRYFEGFLDAAQERGTPFVLDTATWRANPDWGAQLGYDRDALAAANADAVAFARELAGGRPGVTINGTLGPRGDGYVVGDRMSGDEAAEYHGVADRRPARCRRGARHRADALLPGRGDRRRAGRGGARRPGRRVLHGRDGRAAAGRHVGRRRRRAGGRRDGAAPPSSS